MRSGLTDLLTDLSFKEDHSVSEQKQNLLFLNSKRTIWMVRNLQGWAYLLGWGFIETTFNLVFLSEEPRRGREAFAPQEAMIGTPKTLTKWPGLMPLRYLSFQNTSNFWKLRGGVFATSHAKLLQRAMSTIYER